MNKQVQIDIIELVRGNPAAVFTDPNVSVADLVEKLRKQSADDAANIGTKAGRDAIISRAAAVTKLKTSIEEAGKGLNEEHNKVVKAVNAVRNKAKDALASLKDEIRKPVTDWEEQEASRIASHKALIEQIDTASNIDIDCTSKALQERVDWLTGLNTSEAELQEYSEAATSLKERVLERLRTNLVALVEREEQQAELDRLREQAAAQAIKDAKEAAEREAATQAAAAEAKAKADEEQRKLDIAEAEKRAAKKATADAEAKAEADRQELIQKQEDDERARLAEEARIKAEDDARAANLEHRRVINKAAVSGLMGAVKITEKNAQAVIAAIATGDVPHVTINY